MPPDASSRGAGSDITRRQLHRRGLRRHQTPTPQERAPMSPDTSSIREDCDITRHNLCRKGF